MIGIVIVAHGGLAAEYKSAMEHVVGKQAGIMPVSIEASHDRGFKQQEICRAADAVDEGDGVVLVIDMFGSSPSNLALRACEPNGRRILYGANLPMLVKLAKKRHRPIDEAVAAAREAGKKYIDCYQAEPQATH
ncbi:MAG: PTS fructose transporter subunit IIA [Pseudomonadota bacterium]